MHLSVFFGFFLLFIPSSCSEPGETKAITNNASILNYYNLSSPSKVYKLPPELNEISGIDYLANNQIACIQDEEASIYIYDLAKNSIVNKIKFNNSGDFEDIRKVGKGFYVLRSDGTLFHYEDNKTDVFSTVNDNCNTEGLCYIPSENSLLISCKDKSGKIWRFDLGSKTMSQSEEFIIIKKKFYTTAMAYEPTEKELYILSTNQLGVFTLNGDIKNSISLNKSLFRQPEGITFKENGDLLISNEAKGKKATILEFKKQKSKEQ
jgi:uncharacterized protein YjiK